jgi:hypothetical protein
MGFDPLSLDYFDLYTAYALVEVVVEFLYVLLLDALVLA